MSHSKVNWCSVENSLQSSSGFVEQANECFMRDKPKISGLRDSLSNERLWEACTHETMIAFMTGSVCCETSENYNANMCAKFISHLEKHA